MSTLLSSSVWDEKALETMKPNSFHSEEEMWISESCNSVNYLAYIIYDNDLKKRFI